MAKEKEDQHYVPKTYLRGFVDAAGTLFSFNKLYPTGRAKQTGPGGVARKKNFHDLPAEMFENPERGSQQVEDDLSVAEGDFRIALDAFLAEADAGSVSSETSARFAPFVALQWLRTESVRKSLVEADMAFKQAAYDALARNNPEVQAGQLVSPTDYDKVLHLTYLTGNSAIPR